MLLNLAAKDVSIALLGLAKCYRKCGKKCCGDGMLARQTLLASNCASVLHTAQWRKNVNMNDENNPCMPCPVETMSLKLRQPELGKPLCCQPGDFQAHI